MLKLVRRVLSALARRFRSRAVVELENLALRHQLHVLRRQRPGRLRLFALDRLLWVWLYRLWPRCLDAMVLVKPATVVQWHRQGFRLFWRWRSRTGRPSVERETRDLIRQMSRANPLWGAPRIHGELLKLGIEISQATVAKYMVRRRGTPSPTWRSFLRNQAAGIAAIDMFVVASASFRLLYVMIILAHDRRRIVRFEVTPNPTAGWLSRQVTEAFPWDTAPRYLLRDRDASSTNAICVTSCPRTPTITKPPGRIFRSTRIAPTPARSCHARSERWSPSRKSAACIIATNVSPPDSYRIPAHQWLRRGRYGRRLTIFASEVSWLSIRV
jgi:putative transposase